MTVSLPDFFTVGHVFFNSAVVVTATEAKILTSCFLLGGKCHAQSVSDCLTIGVDRKVEARVKNR